jgi:hypothetical protein
MRRHGKKMGPEFSNAPELNAAPSGKAARDDEPAEVRGVNVHAKQKVDGRDRAQLERQSPRDS